MNQYPIWIGLAVAFVMACVTSNPAWWMVMALGAGANGLVMAANGWKMPVRGKAEETIRHQPMTSFTRHKWLGDVIPVGLGTASVGDFLIAAGLLGAWATRTSLAYTQLMIVLCLTWWASGWVKGFRLFDKWAKEARQDCRKNIPIVLLLMVIGNLLHVRGCGIGELHASAKAVESAIVDAPIRKEIPKPPQSKWRDLGSLTAPSPTILRRLREESAKREIEVKRFAAAQAVNLYMWSVSAKSARKGPFCRVTCAAHHDGVYDVETKPELCSANWIPPNTFYVPGWLPISETEEVTNSWPGPAEKGFKTYKLYWSNVQSDPKVVHRNTEGGS